MIEPKHIPASRSLTWPGSEVEACVDVHRYGVVRPGYHVQEMSAQVTSSMLRLKAMRDALGDGPLTLVSEERDSLLKDLNSLIDVS